MNNIIKVFNFVGHTLAITSVLTFFLLTGSDTIRNDKYGVVYFFIEIGCSQYYLLKIFILPILGCSILVTLFLSKNNKIKNDDEKHNYSVSNTDLSLNFQLLLAFNQLLIGAVAFIGMSYSWDHCS